MNIRQWVVKSTEKVAATKILRQETTEHRRLDHRHEFKGGRRRRCIQRPPASLLLLRVVAVIVALVCVLSDCFRSARGCEERRRKGVRNGDSSSTGERSALYS